MNSSATPQNSRDGGASSMSSPSSSSPLTYPGLHPPPNIQLQQRPAQHAPHPPPLLSSAPATTQTTAPGSNLIWNNLNGAATMSSSSSIHVPEVFRDLPLRSGKWTPEEEEYAELIITLFERGQLLDCDNGWTLRAYLSQKLHCAPMRISKKYAGKGIGKMVYMMARHHPRAPTTTTSLPPPSGQPPASATQSTPASSIPAPETETATAPLSSTTLPCASLAATAKNHSQLTQSWQQLAALEQRFIQATIPTSANDLLLAGRLPPSFWTAAAAVMPPPFAMAPRPVPAAPKPRPRSATGTTSAPLSTTTATIQPAIVPCPPTSTVTAPPAVLASSTQQLQQSYWNALQQIQGAQPPNQSHPPPPLDHQPPPPPVSNRTSPSATAPGFSPPASPLPENDNGAVCNKITSSNPPAGMPYQNARQRRHIIPQGSSSTLTSTVENLAKSCQIAVEAAMSSIMKPPADPSSLAHETNPNELPPADLPVASKPGVPGEPAIGAVVPIHRPMESSRTLSRQEGSMGPPAALLKYIPPASNQPMKSPSSPRVSSTLPRSSPDSPDLLAGFDQVALRLQQVRPKQAPAAIKISAHGVKSSSPVPPSSAAHKTAQYSPCLTSRSFDDFHCFLGNTFSIPDSAADTGVAVGRVAELTSRLPCTADQQGDSSTQLSSAVQVAGSTPGASAGVQLLPKANIVPDTMALFTAESYALFAQESAMAASQHAAYMRVSTTDEMIFSADRRNSFDIESMVQLVGEQFVQPANRATALDRKPPVPNRVQSPDDQSGSSSGREPDREPSGTGSSESDTETSKVAVTSRSARFDPTYVADSSGCDPMRLPSSLEGYYTSIGTSHVVSGSEAATESALSSYRGSTSESNVSDDSNGSSDDNTGSLEEAFSEFESKSDSGNSSDDFSRKKTRKRKAMAISTETNGHVRNNELAGEVTQGGRLDHVEHAKQNAGE